MLGQLFSDLHFLSSEKKNYTTNKSIIDKFEIKSISKSSAKFSKESLISLNKDTLKLYKFEEIEKELKKINSDFEKDKFWNFVKNNITYINEIKLWNDVITKKYDFYDLKINKSFIDVAISELPIPK